MTPDEKKRKENLLRRQQEDRRRDHISHYILRLAYCRTWVHGQDILSSRASLIFSLSLSLSAQGGDEAVVPDSRNRVTQVMLHSKHIITLTYIDFSSYFSFLQPLHLFMLSPDVVLPISAIRTIKRNFLQSMRKISTLLISKQQNWILKQ